MLTIYSFWFVSVTKVAFWDLWSYAVTSNNSKMCASTIKNLNSLLNKQHQNCPRYCLRILNLCSSNVWNILQCSRPTQPQHQGLLRRLNLKSKSYIWRVLLFFKRRGRMFRSECTGYVKRPMRTWDDVFSDHTTLTKALWKHSRPCHGSVLGL